MGKIAVSQGDYDKAKSLLQEVLTLPNENYSEGSLVKTLDLLSQIAMLEGNFVEARSLAQKALVTAGELNFTSMVPWIHVTLANNSLLLNEYIDAQTHYQITLKMNQKLKQPELTSFVLSGLGCVACGFGDYSQAGNYFYDALQSAKKMDNRSAKLDIISGIARLLSDTGQPERATRLATYVACQTSIRYETKARNAGLLQTLEISLTSEQFLAAKEQAKQLDLEATVSSLLLELESPFEDVLTQTVLQSLPDPLTERQLEVLELIAEGLSNYNIALRLFVGVSTVKTHINRIYSKLDVKNRTQAVARARELHLL